MTSPASPKAQAKVDQLIDHVNQQIELLAFDEPNPVLLRQMVQSLVDPRRATRLSLIESLSQIGEPATPFLLEGLAHHEESVVRRACCNALTHIGDAASVSGLVAALLQDEDISVKSAAAGALAKIGAPAFDAIRDVLASETASESCKGHAAWAMASMSREVSERLYRIVNDPSPSVRVAVVGAIAQLAQSQSGQNQSAQNITNPSQAVQSQAVQSQARQSQARQSQTKQSQSALSLLTEALSDPSPDVRIEATAHLARLNCQRAYQPLVACLKDPSHDVRKAAVLALGKLGNLAAIEVIEPLQQDSDIAVQKAASLVLEQLEARKTMTS
ncbi:MAG: HEAT repeat domain-containing protein [Cyanobacteria bacterium J06627_32]